MACSSGHGCFGRGTKVLMYGGTVKPVEMVCVGDQLMGDDGTPRNVLELKRGREELYRFEYMDAKEDGSYNIFNKSHILCLVTTQSHGSQVKGDYCEVTVRDWLNWSDRKRRTHAIYRKPVGFNKSRRLKI
ncbi:MAG TPA: Hint domain-containing homing endonuclease, partial [Alphaproteobacteria bacterium]|nr:Hint domain-containing homing endonuclease [Alphaproteobacteria bacterium]